MSSIFNCRTRIEQRQNKKTRNEQEFFIIEHTIPPKYDMIIGIQFTFVIKTLVATIVNAYLEIELEKIKDRPQTYNRHREKSSKHDAMKKKNNAVPSKIALLARN